MRRLITLISAGRNRIVMIRRELPRTEDAGWVQAPYRTKYVEDSPFRMPRPVSGTVAEKPVIDALQICQSEPGMISGGAFLFSVPGLNADCNRPDEPEQFAPERSYDLWLVLAFGKKLFVTRAQ